jgi:hypothetical protein
VKQEPTGYETLQRILRVNDMESVQETMSGFHVALADTAGARSVRLKSARRLKVPKNRITNETNGKLFGFPF